MTFYDDEQKRIAEENKHAKSGGCIGAILALIIVPLICYVLMTFTTGGQVVQSHAVLLYTYYGIPIGSFLPGLPGLTQQSCDLDRTKPANYKQQQAELAETYKQYADLYRQHHAALVKLKRDTTIHEAPEKISTDINGAKIYFCTR